MGKKEQTETMDILEINVWRFSMGYFYLADMQCDREVTSIKGDFLVGGIDDARVMKNFHGTRIIAGQFYSAKRASMSSAVSEIGSSFFINLRDYQGSE